MKKRPTLRDYRLYLVTDPDFNRGYTVLQQIDLALRGGVRMIQIREKRMSREKLIKLADKALKLTRPEGAFLIINDSAEAVSQTGADCLHLGQEDMSVTEARKIVGGDVIIGVSVKTTKEALRAEEDGADYLAVNGVFPTNTKTDLGDLPGLQGVENICKAISLPVVGIGGINLRNCRRVIEAGAHGVAVVTAITMSEDIPLTCRKFFEIMDG